METASARVGFATLIEPWINGGHLSLQKPDLVMHKDNHAFVVNVTITSDQVSANLAHNQKVEYYDQPEIQEWVSWATGATIISFSAVALNWRGVLSSNSSKFLIDEMKMLCRTLLLLALKVCEGLANLHRFFGGSTFRIGFM